ncbi:hypothetical protein HanXRQr2_Chr05g0205351 [Helianthus annuus]|uniref:Uncharacterized protein n=1 Tax=Helianthus annuus TaxID=4232 RepID=A0A9K3IXZ2_HELAN|nr:hypothetical protein HanXRQr2_Chr05g0205351 [Helianthus annuus]KAJ0583953.1 hypothetical protein HanHA89_Chr05g0182671 [Helianthus annuus]KAJ0630316.1 hypothetical protein HanHA300_Chr00c0325g0744341 [Helianthus annuus]KAJ0921981.1 hypothetical protein HanPSC8_Chr05g0198121 [Helianthus annuus]
MLLMIRLSIQRRKLWGVLSKMSYEGSYPPTTKKLLHPYWRFLAHVYLVCISGNKSGIDTLTIRQSSGLAPVNAIVADEHDVEIIDAPHKSSESVENVDLTGIESEDDVADERMIDDTEVNENVGDSEAEVNVESLTAEAQNVEEPISVNPPHAKSVVISSAKPENVDKDPTASLPPRKHSRRDPRINREVSTETRITQELTMPVDHPFK